MTPTLRLAAALAGSLVLAAAWPVAAQRIDDLNGNASFEPPTIQSGKPTNLRVRLRNSNDGTIRGIAFDVTFVPGMRLIGTLDPFQCGGNLTMFNGGVSMRGGSLGPLADCIVVIGVTVDSDTTIEIVQPVGPIDSSGGRVPRLEPILNVIGGIPPKITSPPLPTPAFVGLPFTHQVTVTGTAPVVVTAEGLPPGLAYDDATRRVTGAPTQPGAFLVTLRATNGFAPPHAQVSPVEIIVPPLQVVTPPPLAPPLIVLTPVSIPIEATGGLPPYTWDLFAGALPPGLSLGANGRITGSPTTPGTFAFTVRVRDFLSNVAGRDYQLVVQRIATTLRMTLTPNPAVSGQVVTLNAAVDAQVGAPPAGTLNAWVAGPGTRCPDPFESGPDPVTPIAKSAPLAGGVAQIPFADLAIGRFRVCARYEGAPQHAPSTLGPIDLFVIKGILLPSPKVTLEAPAQARASGAMSGRVLLDAAGTSSKPTGTVRVRAGYRDLGEVPIVEGVATFATTAPEVAGTIAITASYAGDGAFSPAVAEPAYVAVTKASHTEGIPTLGDTMLALVALALAAFAMARLRRRR